MKPATHGRKKIPQSKLWIFLVAGLCLAACRKEKSQNLPDGVSLRLAHLEDYAWRDRNQSGQPVDMKSESERAALTRAIADNPSELLVLRGLGSEASLLHLQNELAESKLPYSERFYIPGADVYHGIGILSSHSFQDKIELSNQQYRVKDQKFQPLSGGVLLSTPKHPRLWIWNSQAPDPEESYERRRNEARILALALRTQMEAGDQVLLSLHSREELESPMFRMLEEIGLQRVVPLDPQGDSWTYRDPNGVLYKQDQWVFASPDLANEISQAVVFDSPDLRKAGSFRHQGLALP